MLVNCVAYKNGQKLADIPVDRIAEHLTIPNCFVWVALFEPDEDELERMRSQFNLHELAIEDVQRGHERPKITEYGNSLFVIAKLIDPDGDDLRIGEVAIFVGRNFVLSVRRGSPHGFASVRARCQEEPELLAKGPAFVLYAILDATVDRYFPILEQLETEIEAIEGQIFARTAQRDSIERLYELKFKAGQLRHAVQPLLEHVSKLYGGRVPPICQDMQEYFRDVYEHLDRIRATVDDLRDDVGTAIQLNLSLVALDASDVNKRLAAWAGIFAVATAFAGIWGMNFENMPELKWTYGYPIALSVIVTACITLYWRFKRAKWL